VNGHPTPPNLAFLDPDRRIQTLGRDAQAAELADYDVLIVLDTSAWVQLGLMADVVRSTRAKKVVIDHHLSEDDLGAESFKDPTAEATGRLIADAADALGVALTPAVARPLFAAVATDTGWFRFASASSETYQLAARLIAAGALPASIYAELYEHDTLSRVRLRGLILSRCTSDLPAELIYTYVRREDFALTGALPSDTEDVVNMTLTIAGTQFAVIFVEQAEGGFKISFRSRCEVDCSRIAEAFGGGGHRAAAGAYVAGAFEDVRARVLDAVRAALGHPVGRINAV
jgi:phosphoesterase RecJ-like protein